MKKEHFRVKASYRHERNCAFSRLWWGYRKTSWILQ